MTGARGRDLDTKGVPHVLVLPGEALQFGDAGEKHSLKGVFLWVSDKVACHNRS
jgi:hypothetical protein